MREEKDICFQSTVFNQKSFSFFKEFNEEMDFFYHDVYLENGKFQ